jgi:enoyl-CoA hydratase/carnithine racemase
MKRRELFEAAALGALAVAAKAQTPAGGSMTDVPLSSGATITVERRGQIVLIGINRQFIQNRIDPPTRQLLAQAYYGYEHDPSLRAAILFGHGENFSRGIDVDARQAQLTGGAAQPADANVINPTATSGPHLTKPMIVVAHGDT